MNGRTITDDANNDKTKNRLSMSTLACVREERKCEMYAGCNWLSIRS